MSNLTAKSTCKDGSLPEERESTRKVPWNDLHPGLEKSTRRQTDRATPTPITFAGDSILCLHSSGWELSLAEGHACPKPPPCRERSERWEEETQDWWLGGGRP